MVQAGTGTPIMGTAQATEQQMRAYLRRFNPDAPDYARLYLEIGERYGVRGDLAFAQSIKETGYWRFGGDVKPEQNNFAGLGATGGGARGASFATPQEGIEAQIQHLYGYATTAPLPSGAKLVDPRFSILQSAGLRGAAPTWEQLNGRWAVPGVGYGESIVQIGREIAAEPVTDWKTSALEWLKAERLIDSPHDPDAPVTWAEFGTVLRRLAGK